MLNDTTKLNDIDTTKYQINFDINVNDWEQDNADFHIVGFN